MAFSRKRALFPSILNLNAIIGNMAVMVQRLIGSKIKFVTELATDLAQVKADPIQIEQMILNLVTNARDAMRSDGRLMVTTSNAKINEKTARHCPVVKPGRYVMMSVSDTGSGMTEDVLAHVFEQHFTIKGAGQEIGLGLATVYGIVSQSGGHIEVSSKVGEGTTFRVYLPLVEEPLPMPESQETWPAATTHETILLVDDEEKVRKMIKTILERSGYNVVEASNGLEGLTVAEKHRGPIHLVLTDLVMPKLSGRDLAMRLTALRPGVRVLFMSGYAEDVVVHRGVESTRADFVQKPFSFAAITKKVREVLDRP